MKRTEDSLRDLWKWKWSRSAVSDSLWPRPTRLLHPWDSPGKNTEVGCHFLFHAGEIFNYILFKNFLIPFLFLFFFWDPYNSNVGAFDIAPKVSETILSSFHSFYFILLFRSYFHHFVFQSTDSLFCFRYPAIDSFWCIFDFSNCVPFCFQGFWSSLLSLFRILFQVVCLFTLHLFGLLCF